MSSPVIKEAELTLTISFFDRRTDNQPKLRRLSWKRFIEHCRNPVVRKSKDGQLFSPATFKGTRARENVEQVCMLVFDYDHDADWVHDQHTWRQLGCTFLIYSTFNHSKDAHRFRVVIPLAVPIPAAQFQKLWEWAALKSGNKVDRAASDASRIFYLPGIAHKNAPYRFEVHDGAFLDWRELDLPDIDDDQKSTSDPSDNVKLSIYTAKNAQIPRMKLETLIAVEPKFAASWARKRTWKDQTPSNYVMSLCNYGALHGLTAEEMIALVIEWRRLNCTPAENLALREVLRKFNDHDWPKALEWAEKERANTDRNVQTFASNPVVENSTNGDGIKRNESQKSTKFPKLPERAFYGLAGAIVRTIVPHTEAHPVALLLQFLVAFGNVIGRTAYFVAEADKHHMNLFTVLVGDTSKGRKGSSLGQILRLFRAVEESWEADRVQSGLSSGEGMIWAVRDAIVGRAPIKEHGRVVDYEEIVTDPGVEDKRLMIKESEFASVLRRSAREGNTLSPLIRQAWDQGDLRAMTKNSPATATGAHISIIGHITKDELRRNLDEIETANGFANRFLWVAVKRSKILPEGGHLTDGELNSLISSLHKAIGFAKNVGQMRRDENARTLWYDVYEVLSSGYPGMFGAVTSRAEAQVMRIACLYALLELSPIVRRGHLDAALALWRYCEASARFIFGDSTGDRVADSILEALREVGDSGLTRTDISYMLGRNASANRIKLALSTLLESGLARSEKEPAEGGRPAERWFVVNTLVDDEFNERNEESPRDEVSSQTSAYSNPPVFHSLFASEPRRERERLLF